MPFVSADLGHISKFNSANSSKLLDIYEEQFDAQISEKSAHPKSKTFAPSSIRCPRISWFRLRGVQPDRISKPDRVLEFSTVVGTACHEMIQSTLIAKLKDDWIDVQKYLESINPDYVYTVDKQGYETKVRIDNPPVQFAVDGIIHLNDTMYLLEIKSSEYGSWKHLSEIKPHHKDQILCYATLLHLDHAMVMYIDRLYGDIKCFEIHISVEEKQKVWDMFSYVQKMVECNIAPDKLPPGDSWCSSSMCNYYEKCKQW